MPPSTDDTRTARDHYLAGIRAEIAAGTYETPHKLDVAMSRLLPVVAPREFPPADKRNFVDDADDIGQHDSNRNG